MKRTLDLFVSILLILLLSPLLWMIAALVWVRLGRPVIFAQRRPGKHGKPFFLYKFRTMTDGRDEQGRLLSDQARLTGFGLFLRKYSLDELPQLFNVVKGEISLVGPRPLLMEYLPLYTAEQSKRHDVMPGITGWAQVNGRNAITWEEKFKLDEWYVTHRNFWLDIWILALTLKKVIRSEEISYRNHATMPVFKGNATIHE